MSSIDISSITSWHAHIYFDAATRDAAWKLRESIPQKLDQCEFIAENVVPNESLPGEGNATIQPPMTTWSHR